MGPSKCRAAAARRFRRGCGSGVGPTTASLRCCRRGGSNPTPAVDAGFADSAGALLEELFPGRVCRVEADHPLLTGRGGFCDVRELGLTRWARLELGDDRRKALRLLRTVEVRGRPAVLWVRGDLSLALAGQTCWEHFGLGRVTARGLAANFLAGGAD